jgi:D-alanyl-D-alanine carboxypeptidase
MCGPHRKRPAAEEADDDEPTTASRDSGAPAGFKLSSLPPTQVKPSSLLGPAAAMTPVVVFAGPGKKSAEAQIAAARGKPSKGRNDKSTQVASAAPGGAAPPPNTQFRDAFGPIPSSSSATSTAPAPSQPPWLSFAPAAAQAATPALAATPTPVQVAVVPLPRPRPKLAARKSRTR